MSDVLQEICAVKRQLVATRKAARSLGEIESLARSSDPPRGFYNALEERARQLGYGLICEIKKASPSKGLIRADFDPSRLAVHYAAGGATCLSVLTDEPYFMGRDEYLQAARLSGGLPCLRKDFMLDPYQIVESRMLGADCVLLIMAALAPAQAAELEDVAHTWGMDVLIEVHDAAELEQALALRSALIGINNRNLKTLTVDIGTFEALAPKVPHDRLLVAESGLQTKADLDRLAAAGAMAFLIGESLMRQRDVAAATAALLPGAARDPGVVTEGKS